MSRDSSISITLDIDWAPDFMIDDAAGILIENRVKATWFVTHDSSAIRRLRRNPDLFELGIHPNCLPGSTQGDGEEQILSNLKRIVPEATAMRTHSLYQHSSFLAEASKNHGIKADLSIFLPGQEGLKPLWVDYAGMYRIPYFWQDDCNMYLEHPSWDFDPVKLPKNGLMIFNFHPVHIVMNGVSVEFYNSLKAKKNIAKWDMAFTEKQQNRGAGTRSFYKSLVHYLKGDGGRTVSEIMAGIA